ncbi:MAG: GatB/YqeY domain-containing protein [Bacteroidales bacterium]|nr:GatB/YqeY domain-containing protein [Bacteroidales bacterium]
MSLENQINADIKQAMLAKKKEELEALRAIKSAVLLLKTSPEVNANNGEISDAMELSLLQKLVKQRREAADIYVQQGRQDLADVEMGQAEVISRYLPKQMDRGEVEALLREIIAEVGATSPKDMGKVMGIATKRLAGKADNKMVSEIVKALLMQ